MESMSQFNGKNIKTLKATATIRMKMYYVSSMYYY